MTTSEKTLDMLMNEALPNTGRLIMGNGLFMEALDPNTQEVWMCPRGVTREEYKAWQPEAPYMKIGTGRANMDRALFRHSPGNPSEKLKTKTIGGHECFQVAKPADVASPESEGLPTRITVVKGHTLGFEAGRKIRVFTLDGEHFVEVVRSKSQETPLKAPGDSTFSELILDAPWIVDLPHPTTTYFWATEGGPTSFQGPITLPQN